MSFVLNLLMVPLRMIQRALLLHPGYWSSPAVIGHNLMVRLRFLTTTRLGLFVLLMLLTVLGSIWADLNDNGNGLAIIVSIVVGFIVLRVTYRLLGPRLRLNAVSAGSGADDAVNSVNNEASAEPASADYSARPHESSNAPNGTSADYSETKAARSRRIAMKRWREQAREDANSAGSASAADVGDDMVYDQDQD